MPVFTLTSLTCHRFVIASITVCSKGLCDTFCTNSLYARVGGIPVSELNVLEREFLRMIDWRLTVSSLLRTRTLPPPSFVDLLSSHLVAAGLDPCLLFVSARARSSKNITSISSAQIAVGDFSLMGPRPQRAARRAMSKVRHRDHLRQCKARYSRLLFAHTVKARLSSSTQRHLPLKLLKPPPSNKTWRLQICRTRLGEGSGQLVDNFRYQRRESLSFLRRNGQY
jgi:hypothetical protein